MATSEELKKPIAIINRQHGQVERVVYTKQQYLNMYATICHMNDVEMAIKIWCDFTEKNKKELLRDFDLIELINCFSTNYIAQYCNSKRKRIEVKDVSQNSILRLKI